MSAGLCLNFDETVFHLRTFLVGGPNQFAYPPDRPLETRRAPQPICMVFRQGPSTRM
jgi:hypothetical protein